MSPINLLSSDISLPNVEAAFLGISGVYCVNFAMIIKTAVVVIAVVTVVTVLIVKTVRAIKTIVVIVTIVPLVTFMAIVTVMAIKTIMAIKINEAFFSIFLDSNRVSNTKNAFQSSKEFLSLK